MTSKPFPFPRRAWIVLFFCILVIAFCFNTEAFAQPAIAVDDSFVIDDNTRLLYIGHNDQDPQPVTYIVSFPTHGYLVNNGQTVSYGPNSGYVGSDSFTYKWCWVENQQNVCGNTATVTLDVVGSYDGMNNGSCPINRKPQAPTNVAQPVNVTNGNMWLTQSDYSLPGIGEPIQINRFYNSRSESSGLFGFGWSTAYDEYLTVYDDKMVRLNLPDAKGVFFGRPNTTSPFKSISPDVTAQIVKNVDNTFTLTFQDGRVHQFGTNGSLLWQRDRNGNQTTLGHDTNNNLTVTDAVGRILTLVPNTNGTISQIYDSIGVIADYEYDLANPAFLKTVTYHDGSKYKFEYVNKVVNGVTKTFLATVKDALDNILETHEYDTQGRATTSEKQGGVEKYTFTYYGGQTFVTDARGNTTKYWFSRKYGKTYVTQTQGVCSCGGSGSENTWFEYDVYNLNLVRKTDALGRQTSFEYS